MQRNISEDIKWIKAFSGKIGLSDKVAEEAASLYTKNYRHINRLRKIKLNPVNSVAILSFEKFFKKDKAYFYILTAVLLKAQDTLELYRQKGISEEIFYDTMIDIAIWSDNCKTKNGVTGIDNLLWIQNHLNCKIFKLGRLQFQPFKFYLPPYAKNSTDIRIGEKVLNVHIPQGEKLLRDECEKAFSAAETFFTNYNYKAFICDSWLLCERNREFISDKSNIIAFMNMFNILGSSSNPSQTIERVFGKKESNPELYPENTTLQRQCKAYILSGGKPGTGFGVKYKS